MLFMETENISEEYRSGNWGRDWCQNKENQLELCKEHRSYMEIQGIKGEYLSVKI